MADDSRKGSAPPGDAGAAIAGIGKLLRTPQAERPAPKDVPAPKGEASPEDAAEDPSASTAETVQERPRPQPKTEPKGRSAAKPKDSEQAPQQHVPYERLEKVTKANQALESRLQQLEGELSAAREQIGKADRDRLVKTILQGEKPSEWAEMSETEQAAWLADEIVRRRLEGEIKGDMSKVRHLVLASEIADELDISMRQAKAVAEIKAAAPALSTEDCLVLAQARIPDLFESGDTEVVSDEVESEEASPPAEPQLPPSHAVRPPARATSARKPPDRRKQLLEQAASGDKRGRTAAIGALLKRE